MYISVLGQFWLDGLKVCWLSERLHSNCPVGLSLKRSEIPTASCSFVQYEKKTSPQGSKSWQLFLRRKGKSEDHCRLSYITSRYQALLVYIRTQYIPVPDDSPDVVFYHLCMICMICMIIPIIYNFTIRPDTTTYVCVYCTYMYSVLRTMYCTYIHTYIHTYCTYILYIHQYLNSTNLDRSPGVIKHKGEKASCRGP